MYPARLRDERLPLGSTGEDEVESGLEDLLHARAGHRVGKRVTSGVELLHEPAGGGEVDAGGRGVEGLRGVARRDHRGGSGRKRLIRDCCFTWMKFER
jgi:hypothetical protein